MVPRATTAFFVLVFIVFTCVEPYLAAVNNPNENTRTYMTMAIVENHTFRLDEIVVEEPRRLNPCSEMVLLKERV